jgi:uracil-DNA glycosylase family 4
MTECFVADWRDKIRDPDCTLCPLHEHAQHVCLMGSGSLGADIAIIGEAPGAREDDQHEAFVGPSGKLLNELLGEAGLKREDVYISNATKCRPLDNRTPTRGEAKTCSAEFLFPELEKLRPKYVLLLGNSALQAVAGKSGITKHRGSSFNIRGFKAFATFHPAAVLRNPKYSATVKADFIRFGRMVRGEDSITGKTDTRIIHTAEQLRWLKRKLDEADEISYDLETYTEPADDGKHVRSGLMEWHGHMSKIVTISFTWEEHQAAVLPLHHVRSPWKDPDKVLLYLKSSMERADCKYIGHNGKFDNRWLYAKGIKVPQTFDTMIAAHVLDENRPKGLKPLSQILLGADAYDVGEDIRDAFHMPIKKLCIYNGKDTDYTLQLYHIFREQLKQEPRLVRVFKLMMQASNALVEIEAHGVWMDPERWNQRSLKAIKNTEKAYAYINEWVPKGEPPLNPNSPKQLANLMFNHLNLGVLDHTKSGAPSTAESVLLRLAKEHPMPDGLLKYRKWAKYLSTYFLPWKYEHSDDDSYIHGSYRLTGTTTGRLSGSGGLQQVPRDIFIRSLIGAPPGWAFVEADFSQAELRAAAMIANETRLLRQFARGEDVHMIRAMRLTGKAAEDVTKEERKKAKAVNFGFLFSMGARKFVEYARDNYGLDVSLAEAERIRLQFFEDYPALLQWHSRQKRLAHRYKQVQSPIGRVRHLPDIDSENEAVRAEAERQAINAPVQSFASDLMLIALVVLHQTLPRDRARIVGTVHDALLFQVRDDYLDEAVPLIKHTMENPPMQAWFDKPLDTTIVADVSVGHHWGEGHDWEPGVEAHTLL